MSLCALRWVGVRFSRASWQLSHDNLSHYPRSTSSVPRPLPHDRRPLQYSPHLPAPRTTPRDALRRGRSHFGNTKREALLTTHKHE